MPRHKTYRILSFDGGGIRGLMTAVWLARLEEKLGAPLKDHFDLVAGTSTGSILACAVSMGLKPGAVVDLYVKHGREVFPSTAARLWNRFQRVWTEGPSAPKYDGKGLEKALKRVFQNAAFGNLKIKPTLVFTYDTLNRQAVVFKNTRPKFAKIPVWEVCKASSSAPTFFPGHVLKVGRAKLPLIDGGVVANNPTACAIAEAVRLNKKRNGKNKVPLADFVVASFGTGEATRSITIEDSQEWGALEWVIPLIDVLFDGSADAVDYIARQLISDEKYFRFQTRLEKAYDDMDNADATNLNALIGIAEDYLDTRGGDRQMDRLVTALRS